MILEISNYMCHENLTIDLKKFDILSGTNGSGKSAVFHAINWLIGGGTNNHITKSKKNCNVKIKINEDTIERRVVNGKYYVKKNNTIICTTKESLHELNIDLNVNYINQFESLFLLNETPKNQIAILNDIFDIEKIENGLIEVNKDLKNNNKILIEEKEKTEKYLEKIKILEKLWKKINELTEKKERSEKIITLLKRIYSLKKYSIPCVDEVNKKEKIITLLEKLNNIKIKHIETIRNEIDFTIYNKVKSFEKIINELQSNKEQLNRLFLENEKIKKETEGVECPLCKTILSSY